MMPFPAPSHAPSHAMVLAAGLGLRMRPITEHTPKPLVEIGGRSMLDRALDHLAAAGIQHLVVNTHWLPEKIQSHLAGRPEIRLSFEEILLETGGGVTKALPWLGSAPFFVVNADIVWTDGESPALRRLASAWNDATMDALLLLQPVERAVGYEGNGDFFLDTEGGSPCRRGAQASAPFLFSGVQLLSPRLFAGAPEGKFSLNLLYDRALSANRLCALVHQGGWFHVGTPGAIAEVEQALHKTIGHKTTGV